MKNDLQMTKLNTKTHHGRGAFSKVVGGIIRGPAFFTGTLTSLHGKHHESQVTKNGRSKLGTHGYPKFRVSSYDEKSNLNTPKMGRLHTCMAPIP